MWNEKEALPRVATNTLQNSFGAEVRSEDGLHPNYQHNLPIPIEYSPFNDSQHSYSEEKDAIRKPAALCGLPKTIAITLFVIVLVLVLALALGLGLGLGLGLRGLSRSAQDSVSTSTASSTVTPLANTAMASSSSDPSSTSTSLTSSASTSSAPPLSTSSSSTSTTGLNRSCPTANSTSMTESGHTFLVLCDFDVHSPSKTDLSSTFQSSFELCVSQCAGMDYFQKRNDISASWNWEGTGQQKPGTCWCVGGTNSSQGGSAVSWAGTDLALIQS